MRSSLYANFRAIFLAALGLAAGWLSATHAQVPPSASEIRSYTGLLAAAASGDAVEIERLVGAGHPVDARDLRGRTALHYHSVVGATTRRRSIELRITRVSEPAIRAGRGGSGITRRRKSKV